MKNIITRIKNNNTLLLSLTLTVIPLLITISIQIFYTLINPDFRKAIFFRSYLIGLIITICVYGIITAIAGSSRISTIIICTIFLIFMIVNQFKIIYANDPILFSDVFLLNDTGSLLEITSGTMGTHFLKMLPLVILLTIMLALICVLSYRITCTLTKPKTRIIMGVTCVVLLVIIFFPNKYVTKAMKYLFTDEVMAQKDNHTTTNIAYYSKNGIVGGLYGLLLNNRFEEPDTYNDIKDELDDIMIDNSEPETVATWGTPNIVMIFSESFYDMSQVKEIEYDKPITENFNKLKEKGIFANMISPSFGGISANVEFEVLSGSNIGFYSEGYIPYMQLMNNDNYYNAPYFTKDLKNNGYKTKIVSTWSDTLFNCARAYDYMGIDETLYSKDFDNPDKKGDRISEKQVVDTIIDNLENKKDTDKLFYMTLTAQTHMPYPYTRYKEDEYDIHITDSPLSKELEEYVECYSQGVYDADVQLGRLYNYIQTYKEPVLLIFYGDHLPYLNPNDNSDAYNELNYFNTDDPLLNTYRKYNTQCLITANFDLGEDDIDYIGPDLIMPYVMSRCDMNISSYSKYLNSTIKDLPSFNCFVAIDSKGKLYDMNNLPNSITDPLELRKCVNWKYFVEIDSEENETAKD